MKKPIVLHKVPLGICSLPGTTFADKIILQVVYTFREKGMVLFDGVIADYCLCSRQHIVNRINALNEMGYLKIEKPKSRYRRIFPSDKMMNLLITIVGSRKSSTDNPTCKRDNYSYQYSLKRSNNKRNIEEKPLCVIKTSNHHIGISPPQETDAHRAERERLEFDAMPWNPNHPSHPTAGFPTENQVDAILKSIGGDCG